ncbi:hypothetical protein niasHT_001906 [Heterodera trifolii]|uniref:protein adenylyltransferase n=1 Tax=Heterodera trifolii TaxID=157864 RepID=A0ABD2LSC1_9BILA
MRHHPSLRLRTFSATVAPSSAPLSAPPPRSAVDDNAKMGEEDNQNFGTAHRRRFVASKLRLRRRSSTAFALSSIFGCCSPTVCLPSRRLFLSLLFLLLLSVLLLLRLPVSFDGGGSGSRFLTRFFCSLDERRGGAGGGRFPFLKRFLSLKCGAGSGAVGLRLMEGRRHLLNHDQIGVEQQWQDDNGNDGDGIEKDAVIVRPPSDSADVESCTAEVRQWREREAVAALSAAKRSRWEGNLRKARSIIEHAYSLAPYNPDILTEYGIYVEMARSDVVQAEGFYLKALARNPKHAEALIRRQKALPLVEEIDNRMMQRIHQKRDRFMRIPHNDAGLKRSMRESYFAYVYHTVAMEGNTINLAQTRSILETRMAVGGKSIVEHNEILGLDAALRYLNQSLLDVQEITLEHILALHKRVLGFADPLAAGVIRDVQVFVGSFRPTDPEFVMAEMEELVNWLNDEETHRLDAVEVAALAHYKLVFIHPFMDGNGRTSRLLMNWVLLRAGFPPVSIPVEQRHRYYHVLREANDGDLRPFIRFIAELTDRTLESLIAGSVSSVCEIGDDCSAPSSPSSAAGGGDTIDATTNGQKEGEEEALDANRSNGGGAKAKQQQQQFVQPFCAAMETDQQHQQQHQHGLGTDGN